MPYEVTADEVVILKAENVYKDDRDNVIGYDHTSVLYRKGEIVKDEDISPVVLEQIEAGDEHLLSLISPVEEKSAKKEEKKQPTKRGGGDS